ncbi:MAG: bifunctional glutamate N-acetyltransferase/amino-acid acetyltransferase ArgJ [Planctomycetia bacterium]
MAMVLPKGYRFAGVHCGVKADPARRDVSLATSDGPAAAAAVFTTNRVAAAPVQVSRGRVPGDAVRGVVLSSGNANACTGDQGRRDAEAMTARLADRLGCAPAQVLVCSTGVIGRPLPIEKILTGIDDAAATLGAGAEDFERATLGVMTTDTRPKSAGRTVVLPEGTVRVVGFCKGAAMIGPNMATMLAVVMTDAAVPAARLDAMLRAAVDRSFHCVSVEGHTSTNDTVILLANGAAGTGPLADDAPVAAAVAEVCMELAQAIARDGEGLTHFITIDVAGAPSDADARRIAKAIADSPLVKTAICGADPNWGRIVSAAGYAGVPFAEEDLSLVVNGLKLYDRGAPTPFDKAAASASLRDSFDTHIELQFTLGAGACRFWTCDLTHDYVSINADYTT